MQHIQGSLFALDTLTERRADPFQTVSERPVTHYSVRFAAAFGCALEICASAAEYGLATRPPWRELLSALQ
ncbi:MAG: hypothetical protein WCB49_06625 [Gammaproteobacteria bacterium]